MNKVLVSVTRLIVGRLECMFVFSAIAVNKEFGPVLFLYSGVLCFQCYSYIDEIFLNVIMY